MTSEPWADRIPEHFKVRKEDGTIDIEATVAKLNESYLALLVSTWAPTR